MPCIIYSCKNDLDLLLWEYEPQFAKDETSIGTTPLTSMTIDTGTSKPISQKPYHIAMKHYQWVKDEIEKLLADYRALNKVTRKFTWPMPKAEDIFFQTKWSHIFHDIGS